MAYVYFINAQNKYLYIQYYILKYSQIHVYTFFTSISSSIKTDIENNSYRSQEIMGRCHIKRKEGQRDSLVSLVSWSREQCRRHLFPFIKLDIFPTRSSGAIPFLSISFSLFLKPAARTKAAQRPWNKRLSSVHKIPYNRLFLRAVKKEIKEGWIFHSVNPHLSLFAWFTLVSNLVYSFSYLSLSLFLFRWIRLRPISASCHSGIRLLA